MTIEELRELLDDVDENNRESFSGDRDESTTEAYEAVARALDELEAAREVIEEVWKQEAHLYYVGESNDDSPLMKALLKYKETL